jgi:predicted nucleic acid-binding protein
MPSTIISDTSCLIVLSNINELDLLHKMYGSIFTTPEVASEFGQPLPDWIVIKSATDKYSQRILEMQVDKGEASAIALALELSDCIIILDDNKARKVATHLGIAVTGTIGIIIRSKLRGIIPSIKPYLHKIKQTNFRLSEELEKDALRQANE